ncbi:MAG: glycerophosphodiester phosphodiesterase family protein [Isosphaeraceae bacterium]|nr:glycerophosphodiester phosphodiesterase family protein [Isosphaeraceae bacterium]
MHGWNRRGFLGMAAGLAGAAAIAGRWASAAGERNVLPPYVRPTNIAHRGASGVAPEHTEAAYRLALEAGADFVEPDLQLTKDGKLVCLHDLTLERTTDVAKVFPDRSSEVRGRKLWLVSDFTLAEIKTLDAGSWKDPKYKGAKVLEFQEMIDIVKGKAGIIPETKSPETYGKLGLKMEPAVMKVLAANGLDKPGADPKTPVIIQSFSEESLKILRREHDCKLPLAHLFGMYDGKVERLRAIKEFADGIAPMKAVVMRTPAIVADAHALGMSVTIWTCREGQTGTFPDVRAEMKHFLDLGVDAIFTDNPDRFPRD